jgi:Ser/Thr protein kinase RdoA (MazF antagonist)
LILSVHHYCNPSELEGNVKTAAIHWSFSCEDAAITTDAHKAHGLKGSMDKPDWQPLTLSEVDALLRRYPTAGGATRVVSVSPRPFSAASVVETPQGKVFVKRHHRLVRDVEGLLEEHRLIAFLEPRCGGMVAPVLADADGETVVAAGEWTYEVHAPSPGLDIYEQALSWTPFFYSGHARAAGRALAQMHLAAEGYPAPPRKTQSLVTSFTIFAGDSSADGPEAAYFLDPYARMEAYLEKRPLLREYAEQRDWRASCDELLMPFYGRLEPWLKYLRPLWTHNDFHASNLTWSGAGEDAKVRGVIDFGLADRTNAVHDLATAIERNVVEWLRMDEADADLVHFNHLDALLAGYRELCPLGYEEARALAAMLPLVHCEFALSETDYFLSILHSEEKAFLAYEGYFLAHARWFQSPQGRELLGHLERWAEQISNANGRKQ